MLKLIFIKMKSLNFQKLNITGTDVLTRLQMKKIVGGHSDGPGVCLIGKVCYSEHTHSYGICYPRGLDCLCVAQGVGVFTPECDGMA